MEAYGDTRTRTLGLPEQNKQITSPFHAPINVGFIVSKKSHVFKTWILFSGKIPTFRYIGNPRSTHHIRGVLMPTIDILGYEMNKKETHFENVGLIWLENNQGIGQ